MRIMIVAPRSITGHFNNQTPFRFDYAFWNFFMPLSNLGNEVLFFDTQSLSRHQFNIDFERFKPDLVFCVMTGNPGLTPDEPWEQIKKITDSGVCKTFNWYCDDTWRFDSFSKNTCEFFNFCSTTEIDHIQKYKSIGYQNIRYANWHSNPDAYSTVFCQKNKMISFVGRLNEDRVRYLKMLESNNISVQGSVNNASFEDMIHIYSSAVAGINFTVNAANGQRQMKARIFEIPATRSMLLTEHVDGIESIFKVGKEILVFHDENDLLEKARWINDNHDKAMEIARAGHERFMKEHTSQIRLRALLETLK